MDKRWYDPTRTVPGDFLQDMSSVYGTPMVYGKVPIDGAAIKAEKLAELSRDSQQEVGVYVASYPEFEMQTFPVQSSEAKAWNADQSAPTPAIDMIAAARGIDPAELRARTYAKTIAFEQVALSAAGKRQALEDRVTEIVDDDPDIVTKLAAILWQG